MGTEGQTRAEILQWLLENCLERFAQGLERMTGERPRVASRAAAAPPEATRVLWWEQGLSLGGPQALVWAGAPEASWLALGSFTLRSAGLEPAEPADARNTYLEILSQVLSGLAQALGGRLEREVTCEGGREVPAPPESGDLFAFEVTLADSSTSTLWIGFASGLVDALAGDGGPVSSELAPAEVRPAPPAEAAPADKGANTLDLLMEVELPVSVSFGRAELALKDVLKLSTGSIVELNRSISDPVEVIVNNCVIARGEVVVVEGNYGVRIQEIISREKRLRTLK